MRKQALAIAALAIMGTATTVPASSPCTNGVVIPEPEKHLDLVNDCKALLAIRDQLSLRVIRENGEPIEEYSWTAGNPITDWWGVTVDRSRVTRLELRNADPYSRTIMEGQLPPELGELTALRSLGVASRDIEGPIPPELGNLTNLLYLHLVECSLTGPVPSELGELNQLLGLSLYSNSLSGPIPPELFNLEELEWLDLRDNNLTGPIPPGAFDNLKNLEELNLGNSSTRDRPGNDWKGPIPPEISRLRSLRYLHMGNAGLTGSIPPEVAELSNLRLLHLSHNQLTGPIPPEFGQLERLETVSLDHNGLTGPIPPELGRLSELVALYLNGNQLTGSIPPELGQLGQLHVLDLSNNALTGLIPPELSMLSQLVRLILTDNAIVGPLPRELGQLGNLFVIEVDPDVLVGCIPAGLARFFDGPACPEFANPCENGIAVENPEEHPDLVRDCRTLLALRDVLGGDYRLDWTGDKPIESWEGIRLRDSQVVAVGLNKPITGVIPPEVGELSALRRFVILETGLTGAIPPQLGQLTTLEDLRLVGNPLLTGSIPPELGQLVGLRSLRGCASIKRWLKRLEST